MPDESLVSWLREQIKAGYDTEYLRDYLVKSGYDPRTVDECITALSGPAAEPQQGIRRSRFGFIISLIAGLLILIFQILGFAAPSVFQSMPDVLLMNIELIDLTEIFGEFSAVFNMMIGAVMILGAVVIRKPGKELIGGIAVLALSLLGLVMGLPLIIAVISIAGGALGLFKK